MRSYFILFGNRLWWIERIAQKLLRWLSATIHLVPETYSSVSFETAAFRIRRYTFDSRCRKSHDSCAIADPKRTWKPDRHPFTREYFFSNFIKLCGTCDILETRNENFFFVIFLSFSLIKKTSTKKRELSTSKPSQKYKLYFWFYKLQNWNLFFDCFKRKFV